MDVTTDPNTKFTFTTSIGPVGFLTGPNNSVYQSDSTGGYRARITATYTNGPDSTCTDTANLNVLRTRSSNDLDTALIGGGAAAAFLFWGFTHHTPNDHIDFDTGDVNQQTDRLGANSGLNSYGEALPADSPFNTERSDK